MGALDPAKILMILVIALVVLGPERMPRMARQLGSAWRELTRIRDQVTEEVRSAIPLDDLPRIPRPSPGSISGFVASLTNTAADGGDEAEELLVGDRDETTERLLASQAAASSNPGEQEQRRHAPLVVVHPSLGDFAFLLDDPSMN